MARLELGQSGQSTRRPTYQAAWYGFAWAMRKLPWNLVSGFTRLLTDRLCGTWPLVRPLKFGLGLDAVSVQNNLCLSGRHVLGTGYSLRVHKKNILSPSSFQERWIVCGTDRLLPFLLVTLTKQILIVVHISFHRARTICECTELAGPMLKMKMSTMGLCGLYRNRDPDFAWWTHLATLNDCEATFFMYTLNHQIARRFFRRFVRVITR